MPWSYWALLALNVGAFVAMGIDKGRARRGRGRIAERTLWGWGLLGGSLGLIAGMWCWRHKTQKPSFYGVVYGTALAQMGLFGWLV